MPHTISDFRLIQPGQFEPSEHWYPKALNAQIHPLTHFFLTLSQERIIKRYCHLRPTVNPAQLASLLEYQPRYFVWAGADLLQVTSAGGKRQMLVVETNSCPSGQKSMPLLNEAKEQGGYRQLMEHTFKPRLLGKRNLPQGELAVLYDKNPMEATGYAAAMADTFQEPVWLVPAPDEDAPLRFEEQVLQIRDPNSGEWRPIRAAFRYVTQRPWNRLPIKTKSYIFNPVIACLAGGRNKMMAAKAYDFLNADLANSGLKIITPETIWDVSKAEIPLWVHRLGGQAVVKVPYSNAGQGVFTIVNTAELDAFMAQDFHYNRFIVQSLIGNYNWSSTGTTGKLYHIGTVPNLRGRSYVADVRLMIQATASGLRPLACYARRAAQPLVDELSEGSDSWAMLGTNLSYTTAVGEWGTDTNRLLLMDHRDFNKLGLGLDDLIEGYVQTVLATVAIDRMAIQLMSQKGTLRTRLFRSLNDDPALLNEIM